MELKPIENSWNTYKTKNIGWEGRIIKEMPN